MDPSFECMEVIRNPGELNHLLLCVKREMDGNRIARYEMCKRCYDNYRAHALLINVDMVIDLAIHLKLIVMDETTKDIHLTDSGKSFICMNTSDTYELTPEQRSKIVKYLLFSATDIRRAFDTIFSDFYFNDQACRYEERARRPLIDVIKRRARYFAYSLKFIRCENGIHYIVPEFSKMTEKKIVMNKNPELWDDEPTDEQMELFGHAEQLVEESERSRLRALGRNDLAERVRRVSLDSDGYGYDIRSFESESSRIEEPDRFLEVKSYEKEGFLFYISRNEMKKARMYGDKYHVIFVGNHSMEKTLEQCNVERITNPAKVLFDLSKFELDAAKFTVTKCQA
jgi:hypothetical protein